MDIKKHSRLVILGSHPDTRDNTDWTLDADFWAFNEAANLAWCKRADVIFQMHAPPVYKNPMNRTDPGHWEWLRKNSTIPVFMQAVDPDVPMSRAYPLEEVLREAGQVQLEGKAVKPMSSTIAYAFGLAVHLGYEVIDVWGIEMASNTEYRYQRDAVTLWCGIAAGRGIQVNWHCGHGMLEAPLYGYEGDVRYTVAEFEAQTGKADAELEAAQRRERNAMRALDRAWASEGPEKLHSLIREATEAAGAVGKAEGVVNELGFFITKTNAMVENAGEASLARQEFEHRAAMAQASVAQAAQRMHMMLGVVEYFFNGWARTKDEAALTVLQQGIAEYLRLTREAAKLDGIFQVNIKWMEEADLRIRAAGGEKAVAALLAVPA